MHRHRFTYIYLKFKAKNSAHENDLPTLLKFKTKNSAHENC